MTIYGGTFAPAAAPEKTWRCELTWERTDTIATVAGGGCSQWESLAGGGGVPVTTTTASLDRCDVTRQYVPVCLTKGESAVGGGGGFRLTPALTSSHLMLTTTWSRC